MKIRPKNIEIIKAQTGVKFTPTNANGANWRQQVFNNYRQHLLDQLLKYGDVDDYGLWLNDMQSRHARLYKAANESGDWQTKAYSSEDVGKYQHDYKGDQRFGTYSPKDDYKTDFNWLGIVKAQEQNRYDTSGPRRTSGDYGNHDYKVDNLYSAITDDRRLLGRKEDWNQDSEEFKQWQKELNDRGWETYLDTSDNYYKLRRLPQSFKNNSSTNNSNPNNPNPNDSNPNDSEDSGTQVPTGHKEYGFDWNKVKEAATGILNNPNLYATGRLIGQLINNGRIYDAALKGIRPDLKQTYYTHRQVVGDEATKQAYYRRAAQGQTKAAQPFTSDADRQMAYQYEAKRIGDELRAQGDLADNQEIRRTSDESNQHQWANTQRATEVANANIAALNQANSLKQNLLAQKYASNWASIDNYLKGIEYRKRQQLAEQDAIKDQMFALDHSGYQYTPEYQAAYKKLDDVLEKHKKSDGSYDKTHPDVIKARAEFDKYLKEVQRQQLQDLLDYKNSKMSISWGKSGVKITRKKKDDLLYKSAKDTVDHFRKMSKISSDAQNRKKPKIERLAPHPKGSTRKYQQGGVAPFGVYTPVALGGETTTSSQASTSSTGKSSKSDSGKDTLDLIKTLFSKVTDKALPIDANLIYSSMNNLLSKYEMFGQELSTSDIASMYLSSMQQIVGLQHSKEVHEKAKTLATQNDALNEFAVTAAGNYILQNTDTGKLIESKSLEKEGYTPITNQHLLYLREYSPDLALSKGDYWVENIINNGMGINKIGAQIKALAGNIGSSEAKLEGFSKVESDKIKSGLRELAEAPAGDYKITELNKNSNAQIQAAFKYIQNMLSPSQKAILEAHGGVKENIAYFLSSQVDDVHHVEFDPLTGKAAKDSNGNGKDSDIKSNPLMQMIQKEGGVPRTWELVTRGSNLKLSVNGTAYSSIPKVSEDTSIDKMLSESGFSGVLDSKQGITFGDQNIKPENLKDVMYSNTGGMIVTLPCKIVNGHKEINLGVYETYQQAVDEIESKGIPRNSSEYYAALGEALKSKGLSNLLDSNGYPDKSKFGQFLVVEAYTTSKVGINEKSQYVEKVKNPDKQLEERLIRALSTNDKRNDYSLDVDYWLYGDDVYRGTVFIPLTNNLNAAINAWGDQIKASESRDLETKYQNFNKAASVKSSNSNVLYETK